MSPTVGSTSSYPLRNASDLQTINAGSQSYYNSFLPSVVRDWNELPAQTRESASLNIFKNKLNNDMVTPPRYYNTGKRLRQILHARLRTKCSALRKHLYSKGRAVAWWLMPRTPDPEVGGSSPTRVKPCCVLEQGTFTPQKYW